MRDHRVERVRRIRRCVVRVDRDDPDAALAVLALGASIRPSHARTYGQWLHDWTRTRTCASAYSSSEWLRPSTPGRSKVGAVSMTLTRRPPRVAGDWGRATVVRPGDGTRGNSGRAASPRRRDRRRDRRRGSSASRGTHALAPPRMSSPRAARSGRRCLAREHLAEQRERLRVRGALLPVEELDPHDREREPRARARRAPRPHERPASRARGAASSSRSASRGRSCRAAVGTGPTRLPSA